MLLGLFAALVGYAGGICCDAMSLCAVHSFRIKGWLAGWLAGCAFLLGSGVVDPPSSFDPVVRVAAPVG